jgi:predicted ATPase/class 3 adenylate cyclase
MSELPMGTVTFLFTDVEGSSRLWDEFPDAMGPALARHDAVLQEAVVAHRGFVVKTTGDGIHAVFATARDALDAAVAAQLGLLGEPFGEAGPLRVRMGVHTCEAEYRDGDYFGSEVNRAARLMSVAHGDQVVVSLVTSGLVRDGSVGLVDLGEHRLRDLTVAERIFQVCAPGLPEKFAPLRSLDAFPGNLPLQVTSFIGRDKELAALGSALETSRLVTVVGVGGVGKTRLALQAAAELIAGFPDGVWVCELAAADDPVSMLQVVAAALSVRPRPGSSLEDSIIESLRPRRMLIVLDNCEHLLRSASRLVDRVLRNCAQVHLIATSRESLGVEGEQTWPLGSLAIPEGSDTDVIASDAVRLFVDRAQAARPGFTLSPSNAAAVAEICQRLDGIPLALELAAARVAALSPADISGLLDERFRLLTGGRRSGVERHQTLRATVDWSYSLLEQRERVVFDRLSVFAGGFDARAAQAVVAGDGIEAWDVLDALTDLVAKSMIIADEATDGVMRYQLLETLRQYGREQLDGTGDSDRWRRTHAEHFATSAEEAAAGLRGPDELSWRQRLLADLDNVRAAVTWSLERDDPVDVEYAMRIITALAPELNRVSTEIGEWAQRAVTHVSSTSPQRRAGVLMGAGNFQAFVVGNTELARTIAIEVITIDGASAFLRSLGYGLLMHCEWRVGAIDEAMRVAAEQQLFLDSNEIDDYTRIAANASYAVVALSAGHGDTARDQADAVLRTARRINNPSALAMGLWITAITHEEDDPDAALLALKENLALVRAGANDVNYGGALARIARLRDRNGDYVDGLAALEEALEHFQRVGPRTELTVVIAQCARTFAGHGYAEPAATLAGILAAGPLSDLARPGTPERMERATSAARSQLGDTAYNRAHSFGVDMSYDDAIAFTRTTLDLVIADTQPRTLRSVTDRS